MFELICVTDRTLCREDFLKRIEKIARAKPSAVLLREKDLERKEYLALARDVFALCDQWQTPLILHRFWRDAPLIGVNCAHVPLPILQKEPQAEQAGLGALSSSCHSLEEAARCQALGCNFLIAGHIFATDCKKGVAGRGIDFLKNVCEAVKIPVFAIGGICADNIRAVKQSGARGACVMSGAMTCGDVESYLDRLKNA